MGGVEEVVAVEVVRGVVAGQGMDNF